MVEEAGDGEGADAAGDRGDGGEVGAGANFIGDVAFKVAVFAGGAGIDNDCAGFNHATSNEIRDAGGGNNNVIFCKCCQVVATMEEGNIVSGVCEHFEKWGTDELAAADNGDFLVG